MSFWNFKELLIMWRAQLARAHPLKTYTISQGLHNVPGYDLFPHFTLPSFQNKFFVVLSRSDQNLLGQNKIKDSYKLHKKWIHPQSFKHILNICNSFRIITWHKCLVTRSIRHYIIFDVMLLNCGSFLICTIFLAWIIFSYQP